MPKKILNCQIKDSHKLEIIEMNLEGKVDVWFQGLKLEKPQLNWKKFNDLLCKRFGNKGMLDVVDEFNKLQ